MQIGEKLKEAREEQGLSLDDIQKKTKIQTRHLQAIEKGDFSLMPGSFYTRAFIREYASAVGLNPDELLLEHKDEVPSPAEENAAEYTRMPRSHKHESSSKRSPFVSLLPTVFAVLLILGIAFLIWFLQSSGEEAPEDTPGIDQSVGDEVQLPPETEDPEEDEQSIGEDESVEEDEDLVDEEEGSDEREPTLTLLEFDNNESTYQFSSMTEERELVIETTGSNWLEVEDESGERLYYGTLQSSESPLEIDITGLEQLYLRFGEPAVITITINGLELELPEEISPSAVQRVWIDLMESIEE